jgi:hypothetical protein
MWIITVRNELNKNSKTSEMKKQHPKKIRKTKNLAKHHRYAKPPSLRSTVKAQENRGLQHGGEGRPRPPTAGAADRAGHRQDVGVIVTEYLLTI